MKTILLIFLMCFSGIGFGQTLETKVIGSSGGYAEHSDAGNLHWTVGETITETFSSTDQILTQGFQQFYFEVTPIFESDLTDFEIKIFPNPTADFINVETSLKKDFQIQLFDSQGKMIKYKKSNEVLKPIFLGDLPDAIYYLKILEGSRLLKTFKIQKVNL